MISSERGRIVWRVLFGVVMASLLIGLLLIYYSSQQEVKVAEKAESLADSISKAGFTALSEGQIEYELPKAIGGVPYEVKIDEERNIIEVVITGGNQSGKRYISSTDAELKALSMAKRGETLYITENLGELIFSNEEISPHQEIELFNPSDEPPEFYHLAEENTKEAAAIYASYSYARELHPDKRKLGVGKFKWKNQNTLKIEITDEGKFLTTILAEGHKIKEKIGSVENSWMINHLENVDEKIVSSKTAPSLVNAHDQGWLYFPDQVVEYFQTRTWKRKNDKETVKVPNDLEIHFAAANTFVGSYPTFRLNFERGEYKYVLYYQAMPWHYKENEPGFVFESKPRLEAVT